jgi:alpha-N-arabinofuranosidase
VEYTNGSLDTYWAQQRRKNGRDKPYNVKYWGLGNEIDGPWQLGHKSAEDYCKFALEAAKAMRRVDDSIKLIASGSSHFGGTADWIGWNRTVLEKLRGSVDYISLHTYIGNRENDLERYLGSSSADIEHRIRVVRGMLEAAASARPTQRPIYIAYDEWNVWYRARGGSEHDTGRTRLEEIYNFEDALAMGMFFNSFFRNADVVKMANLAQIVNVIAPIFTNEKGLFLQPIYFPIAEYGKQRGNASLDVWTKSPEYKVGGRTVGYLDVSSTFDQKTGSLYVNVLNRSKSLAIEAEIENQSGRISEGASVWEMNHQDLKAVHTFGADTKVRPVTRNVTLRMTGPSFRYTFPAHSLTILRLKIS